VWYTYVHASRQSKIREFGLHINPKKYIGWL
jgi:hypothetical protein